MNRRYREYDDPYDPYDEVDNLVNDNIEACNTGLPYTEEQELSMRENAYASYPYITEQEAKDRSKKRKWDTNIILRVVKISTASDTWYEATATTINDSSPVGVGRDRSRRYAAMNAVNNYYLELEKQGISQATQIK